MSKKNISTLASTIEKKCTELENPDLSIEDSINIYSEILTIASDLSTRLTQAKQDIQVLNDKGQLLLDNLL